MYSNTHATEEERKKAKKELTGITAVIVSLCIAVGGFFGLSSCGKNKSNKKNNEATTSITAELTTDSNEEILYLSSDFNIDDEKEVEKRANDIYELIQNIEFKPGTQESSKMLKAITLQDITNLIYIVNDKPEKFVVIGNTDKEKKECLQNTNVRIYNFAQIPSKIYSGVAFVNGNSEIPYTYMFCSKNDITKQTLVKLAELADAKINNGLIDTQSLEEEIAKNIKTIFDKNNNKVTDSKRWLTSLTVKGMLDMFKLTKEQEESFQKKLNSYAQYASNIIYAELGKYMEIDVDGPVINKKTPKKPASGYIYEDAEEANDMIKEEETTKVVISAGGNKVPNNDTSIKKETTTTVVVSTTEEILKPNVPIGSTEVTSTGKYVDSVQNNLNKNHIKTKTPKR